MEICIRKIRKSRGMTLRGLSMLTDISRNRLSCIERKISTPVNVVELEKIAMVLKVPMFDLINSKYK
jgi:Predicted transcriptional regulators